MWISHLTTYKLEFAEPDTWEERLQLKKLQSPAPGERRRLGFLPTPEGRFVDNLQDHYAILGAIAERHLPRDAVDREVRQRFGLSREDSDQAAAAWAVVEQEMLGTAPIREKVVPAIFDARASRLYVFAAPKVAEEVVLAGLREAVGAAHAVPLVPEHKAADALTRMLAEGTKAPFLLGRSAELESDEQDGGTTVFKGQDLSDPKVAHHLERGDTVASLSLIWNGAVELTVNAKGEIKRVGELGCKLKPQHALAVWPDIMAKLPSIFDDIMTALGGLKEVSAAMTVEERPRGPVTLGIVAEGPVELRNSLGRIMDELKTKRNIGELIIPKVSNDLQRFAFAWGRTNGIKLTVVSTDAISHAREKLLDAAPACVLLFGQGDEVNAMQSAAAARDVPSLWLSPSRQPG